MENDRIEFTCWSVQIFLSESLESIWTNVSDQDMMKIVEFFLWTNSLVSDPSYHDSYIRVHANLVWCMIWNRVLIVAF